MRALTRSTPRLQETFVEVLRRAAPLAAALSMPASTVPGMDSDDTVDPGDAALHGLLALMAEQTGDDERRETLIE